MKKFTKLFLSCAAMAALTAAVATSAMAAGITATYDEANDGNLTIAYDQDVTIAEKDEVTVLVTTTARSGEITENDILYIDQKTDGDFGTVKLRQVPVATQDDEEEGYLPDGTYHVYVGYTAATGFAVLETTFNVGDVGETIVLGDVNTRAGLDSGDATAILRKLANKDTLTYNAGNTATAVISE